MHGLLASTGVMLTACSRPETARPGDGPFRPAYEKLEDEGRFADRVERANDMFSACELCPRRCANNRRHDGRGDCEASDQPVVYSYGPHFGEEQPLVGSGGSGAIFFSNCNLRCVFCQNHSIAHEGEGRQIAVEELAGMMLALQQAGCHNINLVSPTHVMPNILGAVRIALKKGLRLPLCYNTNGYERVEMIRLLDGIVDIYLPDMKYMDGAQATRYSGRAFDYPEMAQRAVLEMHRQVGGLVSDENGVALRGLMIRHLVMPNGVSGARDFVQWVARNLPKTTYINLMSQYRVEHRAAEFPPIARAITPEEYLEARHWAEGAGLSNLDGDTETFQCYHPDKA